MSPDRVSSRVSAITAFGDALNRGEFAAALELVDPAAEFDLSVLAQPACGHLSRAF
jgi:hypothetical protein